MHIAVCDDEKIFREYFRKLLLEYSFAKDVEFVISEYDDSESLLEAYSSEKASHMDVLFLDIRMNGLDGMEAAKQLRRQGCGCLIVFLTSLAEYVQKGYEVRAFRYLLKEQAKKEIGSVLDACLSELESEEYFVFTSERRNYSIRKRDILYFESRKRIILVYIVNGNYSFYQKLDELEKQLAGQGFLRCHRSFLVQERFVKGWRENALWMEDGAELPVSRTYERAVNQKLMLRACKEICD